MRGCIGPGLLQVWDRAYDVAEATELFDDGSNRPRSHRGGVLGRVHDPGQDRAARAGSPASGSPTACDSACSPPPPTWSPPSANGTSG